MRIIDKPWGREEWIEVNDKYTLKKLVMNKGHRCSLQYHKIKKETFYVLSGLMELTIGNDIDNLNTITMIPGDSMTIEPYTIHRMKGLEYSEYLESSTSELDDVVRLEDDYKRD